MMEEFNGLEFKNFERADVEVFTPIMKRAYNEDSKMHRNGEEGGPPGYDNGKYLKQIFLNKKSVPFSVYKDSTPVGAMNLFFNDDTEGWLEVIFIDSDHWNKGYGQIMWNYVEHKFSQIKIWRLETPGYSKRNHNFYVNKCGFKIIHIIDPNKKNRPYPGFFVFEKNLQEKRPDINVILAKKRKLA